VDTTPNRRVNGEEHSRSLLRASSKHDGSRRCTWSEEESRNASDLGACIVRALGRLDPRVVTAVETHYYWPDLPANMREVLRVLKPGGTIALIAEVHRRRGFDAHERMVIALATGGVHEPDRAPRSLDPGGIHGRLDDPRSKKRLDLRHRTEAIGPQSSATLL
jgi:SAM-dependent methyltransferase